MKVKANVFVCSKSISKSADNTKTYYNASVLFDGDEDSKRVSVKPELYGELEPKMDYQGAAFDIRIGVSKAGQAYAMIVMESIGE